MAITLASPSAAGEEPMAAMNTTPLIDVMLVLLIMFIITIPIQTHKVGIDLPGQARKLPMNAPDPIKNKLTIDSADTIRWNGTAVDRLTLRRILNQTQAMAVEPELQFEPAADARYLMVDEVLADIRRSGVTNMGFVGNERYRDF
ncbi:ExbD/TolR family protein [Sphingobium ummariense]|uniref:Biopolymer transportern ExbD n=1 Tax=Sphingobium ummariense RL-3 TaxID=1346791 RepID=T0IZ94_9SPHN|nr:biopolymer transporter ExbD [Sphingobium ummariense]EQB34100.1 hypothetical protein M529_00355 [Sphingobium ummariense RL-3]